MALETTIVLTLLYDGFAFVGVFVVKLIVGLACCLLDLSVFSSCGLLGVFCGYVCGFVVFAGLLG